MSPHYEQAIGGLVVHLRHEQDDQWSVWVENRCGRPISRISVSFNGDADLSVTPTTHTLPALAAHAASHYIRQTLRPRTERAAGEVTLLCAVEYWESPGTRQRHRGTLRLALPEPAPRPAPTPPRPEPHPQEQRPEGGRASVVNIYHGDIVYGTKDSIEIRRGAGGRPPAQPGECPRCRAPHSAAARFCTECGLPLT